MMFVASWLIGLRQRLSELHRNSFNAFSVILSVILGLNCSALGSIKRANLVNKTVPAALCLAPYVYALNNLITWR
jgi:hypothetical protein